MATRFSGCWRSLFFLDYRWHMELRQRVLSLEQS
nr:MAG TPA: hypothetical protein [Caudoviricetes sp.]